MMELESAPISVIGTRPDLNGRLGLPSAERRDSAGGPGSEMPSSGPPQKMLTSSKSSSAGTLERRCPSAKQQRRGVPLS
jgi:hypothetical protein